MSSPSARAAARPFARKSWRIVVSAGSMAVASGMSSKPITDRSSGTRSPRCCAALTTAAAMRSEKQITAVGRA